MSTHTTYHIQTNGLSKSYGSSKPFAVNNLNLEVIAGTVLGFLGRNGAGKSTTIKMMMDLIRPSKGSATIMGIPCENSKSRLDVSYMPELPALDARLSLRSFLRETGRLEGIEKNILESRINEVLEEVYLADKADVSLGSFSKGMQQRAELAQALLQKPKILILDEPFSGLDPLGRRQIRDLIKSYNTRYGTTVFFSSHILADVQSLCDYIAILHEGRLLVTGKKEHLLDLLGYKIRATHVSKEGVLFLKRIATHFYETDTSVEINISPERDLNKTIELFKSFGAKNIQHETMCSSLEDYFTAMVSNA